MGWMEWIFADLAVREDIVIQNGAREPCIEGAGRSMTSGVSPTLDEM